MIFFFLPSPGPPDLRHSLRWESEKLRNMLVPLLFNRNVRSFEKIRGIIDNLGLFDQIVGSRKESKQFNRKDQGADDASCGSNIFVMD